MLASLDLLHRVFNEPLIVRDPFQKVKAKSRAVKMGNILITGASRGIGAATAQILAAKGHSSAGGRFSRTTGG